VGKHLLEDGFMPSWAQAPTVNLREKPTKSAAAGAGAGLASLPTYDEAVALPSSGDETVDEWILASFGPASGLSWPDAKRAALSAAFQEEEFYSAASVAEIDEDAVVAIIKAAGLKAGSSQDFRSAIGLLKVKKGTGAVAMAGAGESSFKVRVQNVLGKAVVISLAPHDTALSVLRAACRAGLVDPGEKTHALMYEKVVMNMDSTMADYGVVHGAEITVIPNTMGSI
jgi:hypothetical protein